jgi:hypothetical protein
MFLKPDGFFLFHSSKSLQNTFNHRFNPDAANISTYPNIMRGDPVFPDWPKFATVCPFRGLEGDSHVIPGCHVQHYHNDEPSMAAG